MRTKKVSPDAVGMQTSRFYPGEDLLSEEIEAAEASPTVFWRFGPWPYRLSGASPENYGSVALRHALKTSKEIIINLYSTIAEAGKTDSFGPGVWLWWPEGNCSDPIELPSRSYRKQGACSSRHLAAFESAFGE